MEKVSVIIPTYNRFQMLCEAIDSVLTQEEVEVEIIVVDDNSTDETYQVTTKYSDILYIRSVPNVGPGLNRGKGFNKSTGDYIVFIDDDDYYTDKLFFRKAIDVFQKNPELAMVAANVNVYDISDGKVTPIISPNDGYLDGKIYINGFMTIYPKPTSTFPTVFRKSSLLKAGVDSMVEVNDASIYLRALTQGNAFFMKDIIGNYRFHSSNITKALDPNLIIRNMKEKELILSIGKDRIVDSKKWFYNQMMITYGYYLQCRPFKRDRCKVLIWLLKHNHGSMSMICYTLRLLFD